MSNSGLNGLSPSVDADYNSDASGSFSDDDSLDASGSYSYDEDDDDYSANDVDSLEEARMRVAESVAAAAQPATAAAAAPIAPAVAPIGSSASHGSSSTVVEALIGAINQLTQATMQDRQALMAPVATSAVAVSDEGIVHREVKFYLENTFEELQKEGAAAADKKVKLRLRGDIDKIFGADRVTILDIKLLGFDNKFQTSFQLDLDHLAGKQHKTQISPINEECIMVADGKVSEKFASAKPAYSAIENGIANDLRTHYTEYDVDNLDKGIQDWTRPDGTPIKLVPVRSPIASFLRSARIKANQAPIEDFMLKSLGGFGLPVEEVNKAHHALAAALADSADSTAVSDIYFGLSRAVLKQDTIDSRNSANSDEWADKSQFNTSLKDGNVLNKETQCVKSLMVSAKIRFRPLPSGAASTSSKKKSRKSKSSKK